MRRADISHSSGKYCSFKWQLLYKDCFLRSEFHDIQFLNVYKVIPDQRNQCLGVSHICFPMSQQKLDIFHFLLWWLWKGGWARSKDVTMETMSFPVRSYLRMKQMLFVTYWCMSRTLTKEAPVGANLKAVYKVSRCFQAELLFQPAQVFWVSLIGLCHPSTGSICEANRVIGPLKVLLKSWLHL